MPTDQSDIKSIPIYDRNGKLLGNLTGRKEEVERFHNDDLARQIQSDRQKHKDNLRR